MTLSLSQRECFVRVKFLDLEISMIFDISELPESKYAFSKNFLCVCMYVLCIMYYVLCVCMCVCVCVCGCVGVCVCMCVCKYVYRFISGSTPSILTGWGSFFLFFFILYWGREYFFTIHQFVFVLF